MVFCRKYIYPCTQSIHQKNIDMICTLLTTICYLTTDTLCVKMSQPTPVVTETSWLGVLKNSTPVLIAMLAAFIALLQAKSNIISASRIRWIEDLRNTLSEYCSITMDVLGHSRNYKDHNDEKDYEKYLTAESRYDILENKIQMYLNSDEGEHQNLERCLDRIAIIMEREKITDDTFIEVSAIIEEIITHSKAIFGKEWRKSKKLFKI